MKRGSGTSPRRQRRSSGVIAWITCSSRGTSRLRASPSRTASRRTTSRSPWRQRSAPSDSPRLAIPHRDHDDVGNGSLEPTVVRLNPAAVAGEHLGARRQMASAMRGGRRGPFRRWLRRLGFGVAFLVVGALGVFGWAWASLDSSAVARAMIWMDADVGDQLRFPSRVIAAGDAGSPPPRGYEADLGPSPLGGPRGFDAFLRQTDTRAFLVVQDDRVVYERHLGGTDRGTLHTTWSVAKSVLSTLVGIAIDEGLIGSADDTYTYYGADLREIALEKSEVEQPPGEEFHYNNYNPLLLGLVLERVSGMPVAEYASTRLWQPLGAERDATWSLDSEDSGFEKMESGVNATAADYARFGLAFLHGGEWGGSRIVSADWVHDATTADIAGDPADRYQYFWWVDLDRPGRD